MACCTFSSSNIFNPQLLELSGFIKKIPNLSYIIQNNLELNAELIQVFHYFFQDVTINPSLKISIYANTTFSYKNYNSANPTTPFTPNNNALSDEPSHTVLIKYTKI